LECQALFIGYYTEGRMDGGATDYFLLRVAPNHPRPDAFSPEISQLSPTFVAVQAQAMAAEPHHLDQLTGIGLRKALEFLVKDFAVSRHPDDADAIKKKLLGACIDDYMEDPNLKAVAKRAAWLGNDETHYIRRWEDRDITDLKTLIRLTVNWIENVVLTDKYKAEMPDVSKPSGSWRGRAQRRPASAPADAPLQSSYQPPAWSSTTVTSAVASFATTLSLPMTFLAFPIRMPPFVLSPITSVMYLATRSRISCA
jgi:hypothetical protein